jgi:hypothetical protein
MRRSIASVLPTVGALLAISACSKSAPPPDAVVPPAAAPAPPPAEPVADEVPVYNYSAPDVGDWHATYQKWEPTVVFESGGHYYPHQVAGAREVQVYHYQDRYFMPPRDKGFAGTDHRLDPKRAPSDDDYGRARARP